MAKPSLFNPGYTAATTGVKLTYASETVQTVATVPIYKMYRVHVGVTTAFNDSGTDAITVGTTSGGTEIGSVTASSTGNTFFTGVTTSSEITIYAGYAGQNNNASAGVGNVIVEILGTTEFGVEP